MTFLPKFALSALLIPHSNADCERIFSKINNIKTKYRNRLITSTVNGVLLADQAVKKSGSTCCNNFKPSSNMYDLMNSSQIYNNCGKDKKDNFDDDFTF